jgi:glycosyltransferase involved in cell wall biosynthesis
MTSSPPGKLVIWFWGRRGGGPALVTMLVRRLAADGFADQLVVSASRQNEELAALRATGVAVHTTETFDGGSLAAAARRVPAWRREIKRILMAEQAPTVLVPMTFAAMVPTFDIARRHAGRLVYVVHDATPHPGDVGGRLQASGQALYLRMADTLVSLSEATAEALRAAAPQWAGRLTTLPLLGLYPSHQPVSRPALTGRPLRLLVEGRLVAYKGFERLAQALAGLDPAAPLRVTIAGDGPYRDKVGQLFRSRPQVELHLSWSTAAEREALYRSHDVLCCAYDEASQSGVVCDAFSWGMPVIVTPVGALPEQVRSGGGWVLSDMSAAALTRQLDLLCRHPERVAAAGIDTARAIDEARRRSDWAGLLFGRPPSYLDARR